MTEPRPRRLPDQDPIPPSDQIAWRETHDPYQFIPAQNISPSALRTLTERGLFTSLLKFFQDTRNEYLYAMSYGRKNLTNLGGSSPQLFIPAPFLVGIPDIDPEKPLNFTIMDFDYYKGAPIEHEGDFKVVVNPVTSPLPKTKDVLGFEACHSFPADETGARLSCLTLRPAALKLDAIISDDGITFERRELELNESQSQLMDHEDGHLHGKAFGDKAVKRLVVTKEREEEFIDLLIAVKSTGQFERLKEWDLEISKKGYDAYMEQIINGHAPRLLEFVKRRRLPRFF